MRAILLKLGQSILLILGVLVLVFFMVRLTGDPAALMVSRDATPEQIAAFREAMGFNRPLLLQFTDYIAAVSQGDLGDSLRLRLPNLGLITQRLPATLELALSALFFAVAVGVPLGILGGFYPRTWWDALARMVGLFGQTIPSFWLAMILIIVLAVPIPWLPTFGRSGPTSLILPTIALGLAGMGQLTRLTRSLVLEIRNEHYIRTARAKGVSERSIGLQHIARNAALPLVSVLGIQFTYLLGGSVYIETIFSWPGLGSLLNDAIRGGDFPLVQAITIFIAFFAVGINLLNDIIYTFLDPRVRFS